MVVEYRYVVEEGHTESATKGDCKIQWESEGNTRNLSLVPEVV